MSHVTDLKLVVRDLNALKLAAEALGMELVEQSTFKWYGTHVGDYPLPAGFTKADMGKCDYAMRIKGNPRAYEVGVVKSKTGTGYQMLWDFWQGGYGLQEAIGKSGEKLKQGYAVQVAKKEMAKFQRDGFRIAQYKRPDGTLVVKAVRG
jgi:hypothetical protein